MNVVISIKPDYVNKIISKEKHYEFRRKVFKQPVNKVIIYCTSPIKKIIGYFELNEIIKDNPINLWSSFSNSAGICEEDFFKYFDGCDEGFALKIDGLKVFDKWIDVSLLDDFHAPQSFKYVSEEEFSEILTLVQF